jgi:hypothetical protein
MNSCSLLCDLCDGRLLLSHYILMSCLYEVICILENITSESKKNLKDKHHIYFSMSVSNLIPYGEQIGRPATQD